MSAFTGYCLLTAVALVGLVFVLRAMILRGKKRAFAAAPAWTEPQGPTAAQPLQPGPGCSYTATVGYPSSANTVSVMGMPMEVEFTIENGRLVYQGEQTSRYFNRLVLQTLILALIPIVAAILITKRKNRLEDEVWDEAYRARLRAKEEGTDQEA